VACVVAVAGTVALTSRLPRIYEARCSVLLDSVAPPSAGTAGLLQLLPGAGSGSPLDTEIQKITARDFLRQVLNEGRLHAGNMAITDPDYLRGSLNIEAGPGDQVLIITARAPTAELATDEANDTAKVYIERVQTEFDDKTELSKARLRHAATSALQERQAAEKDLDSFLARMGISDPAVIFSEQTAKTADVRNALDDLRRSLIIQDAQLDLYARQLHTIPPTVVAGYNADKNPVIEGYQSDVAALQAQRRVLLFDYQPDSDEVKALDVQIAAKRQAITEAQNNPYSVGAKSVARNPDYAAAQTNYYNAEFGLRVTHKTIDVKQAQLASLEAEQKGLTTDRTLYDDLKRTRDSAADAYDRARDGIMQVEISRITSAPNVRILDAAVPDPRPISPKPVLNLVMAMALGLIGAIVTALFAEYLRGPAAGDGGAATARPRIAPHFALDALPHAAGVPVLGTVPVNALLTPLLAGAAIMSARRSGEWDGGAVAASDAVFPAQPAMIEDALREVGYALAHRDPGERPPVVVVLGARSDDSTAALSAHVAATLVRDGVRVTLVDGDRARPRLNRVFGKPDAPGVAELLAEPAADPRSALHIGAGGALRFLAAGSPETTIPSTDESLRRIFDRLADPAETDLVLVSGPAIWSVRAALPIEQASDGMVLLSPADAPPAETVARARRILSNGYMPRILGVVIAEEQSGVLPAPAIRDAGEVLP
jgi:uncharacterized protein involved in exopolysaccharide biosynthesis/Mrp family chromosome partitioning ATPase